MSTSIIKVVLMVCFVTIMSTHAQADVVDQIEKNFSVEHGSIFQLDNINGSVAISA